MPRRLILASGSEIRATLLRRAGVAFDVVPARIDEAAIKQSLLAERAPPRDIADALAGLKAERIAAKHPDATVIGCDQVLSHAGRLLDKPDSPDTARAQLAALAGEKHQLVSAAVIYEDGGPVWRHIGVVEMQMRPLSSDFIADYVTRNWDSIRQAVGAYKLEEEGARLFTRIHGDYFAVLGLPLLDLLSYLALRGILKT